MRQVAHNEPENYSRVQRLERANLEQIEALNQRGGRTLSIVDLIRAGTISAEMAAYVGHRISQGASVLTAANPGGAGKTALLAALLGFAPRGMPIVTVESAETVADAEAEPSPRCYLAHEIGAGHWYGYLWGPIVARYLNLASGPHMVASCLHADAMDELRAKLSARPLAVPSSALLAIDLILFMHVDRGSVRDAGGYRRRVAAIYESDRGGETHRLVFRWKGERDAFERTDQLPLNAQVVALAQHLTMLAASGPQEFARFRAAYLSYCDSAARDAHGGDAPGTEPDRRA